MNDWRPIWRRPRRQSIGCNLFRLLFNEWLRLWFHSVFDYVNMSSILSDWYLVAYAGFYACICLFLARAGIHPRRLWRIVICRGWGTGTLSSSDRSIGFQVGLHLWSFHFVTRNLRCNISWLLLDPCWASRDHLCPQRGFTSSTIWRLHWGSSSFDCLVLIVSRFSLLG